jgi:glycosyltransferase involved in cell wall biosynthesis
MVAHNRTGLHFTPGDGADLAVKVEWAWTHPAQMETMGEAARLEFEKKYTAERNYGQLMSLYKALVARQALGSQAAELSAVPSGSLR